MGLRNFLLHKKHALGIHFSGVGLVALELIWKKGGSMAGKFYRLIEDSRAPIKLHLKTAHAAISDLKVIKKSIAMSSVLTKEDIMLELQMNQSKYFPHIMDELSFAIVVPEVKNGACEIMVFAVRTSDVKMGIKQAQQYSLSLSSLEPESYSLLRIIFFHKKIINAEKIYAALFYIQQQFRLIVFSKDRILDELKQTVDKELWHVNDLRFMSRLWSERSMETSKFNLDRCFIVHSAEIPSDFIIGLSEALNCEIEAVDPFHHIQCDIPDDIDQSDAMISLGLALRGLNV